MTHSPTMPHHVIVVGSSAGGIEALGVLLSGLPSDFPAPVVLAQHLDPTRPSQLAGILERRSVLPIVSVTEEVSLSPGHVYVIPSNHHVVIRDGRVGLDNDHGQRPRPSIDLLLTSAARSYGENLIAIILTGSGSDGSEGALKVKEAGGCVIIQNPKTAAHPSMPAALPPTAVDHVVDLEQIAPLIQEILHGVSIENRIQSVDRNALDEVLGTVTRHGRIDFHQYKPNTLLRRISRRMATHRIRSLEEYREYLTTHPEEIETLVRSLLIQVTEFFRDPEAFAYLEAEVVPQLIQTGRSRGRTLRLWSAGCATGEESYSLALLFAHALGPELPEWSIKIFATDVDEEAIAFARRGHYPEHALRKLPPEYVERFFEPMDRGHRVVKSLRQQLVFGQQDLSRGVPFPRVDLIACRNLLIYFKPELQQAILDLFAYSLHQTGGYLFLGTAETTRPTKSAYELVSKKWKVYRCVSGPLPRPVRSPSDALRESEAAAATPGTAREAISRIHDGHVEEADLRRSNEHVLRAVPVGLCIIDRTYRIISINAAARRLLGVRDVAPDQDFLHAVRGLAYGELRSAIDRVFRERKPATLPQVTLGSEISDARYITVQIAPFEGTTVESVLVCIENVTELVQAQRRYEAVQAEQTQLSQDLGAANQHLGETNKDLQDANEELQASNEEMMLVQEELQATNEEFEATNEELQATNEELETNNEELQATNEELETTNEELQARSSELHELSGMLENERARLTEIVQKSPFHVMVLRGPALLVESMNPKLLGLFPPGAAVNRPFEDLCADPALEPVRSGVRRSYEQDVSWRSDWLPVGAEGSQRYLAFSTMPTHAAAGVKDGIVVYVEDVTERRMFQETEKLNKLKVVLDNASQLAMGLFDARTEALVQASQPLLAILERLRRVEPGEAQGRKWSELWFGTPESIGQFAETVRDGRPRRLDEVRVHHEGSDSIWDCSLIPITGDRPNVVEQVALTAMEVTGPVLAREELEVTNRLKDTFLSLASHELRTPLTPLSAYVEILAHLMSEPKRDSQWEKQVGEVIERFRRQIGYMSRLTEDLVDISRIRSGKLSLNLKSVDLLQVVKEAREQALAIPDGGATQIEVGGARSLEIEADEMRLVQVVYNLISNALKHAPTSDRVQILVRGVEEDGRKWGRVEVRDYGSGIPQPQRKDLFRRFMQPAQEGRSARSGLGLGLYISAQIVEQHGGRIGVEHHRPGTTVWLEMPLKSDASSREDVPSTSAAL